MAYGLHLSDRTRSPKTTMERSNSRLLRSARLAQEAEGASGRLNKQTNKQHHHRFCNRHSSVLKSSSTSRFGHTRMAKGTVPPGSSLSSQDAGGR